MQYLCKIKGVENTPDIKSALNLSGKYQQIISNRYEFIFLSLQVIIS